MELDTLLAQMITRKASDLHLAAGVPPIFRIDGALMVGDNPASSGSGVPIGAYVPPQSIEAEQSTLGAMLIERSAVEKALEILDRDDFYQEAHRTLYDVIMALAERDEPVDLITVQEELGSRDKLDAIGGIAYLTALFDTVPTAASTEVYAKRVKENAMQRAASPFSIRARSNLTPADVDALLRSALPEEKLAAARQGRDFSATLRHEGQSFRCRVFCERGRLAAAIRVIPDRIPSLDELSLPPIFERLTHLNRGLVLLTGPTGSGKTTTLVSMLNHVNLTCSRRICTVEDPMHYVLPSKLSLVTQRVVGEDVESYERGLLSVMDADADVVMIGYLGTPETARLALELCETGHLVLSQITAESASDAIDRLLGLLGEPRDVVRRLLSQTVQAVIAQNLLRREDRAGRVAANEILIGTPRVRQMIADGQTTPDLLALAMEAGRNVGMQTMADSLLALQAAGVVSREAVENLWKEKGRLPPG